MTLGLSIAVLLPLLFVRRFPLVVVTSLGWTVLFGSLAGAPVTANPVRDLVIMCVAPIAVGYAVRLQRQRGEQLAQLRLAQERARLARDVHDSVGHHLTAIKMQATAALRVPGSADGALSTIADVSSAALTEVRDFVQELRTDIGSLAERLSGPACQITVHGNDVSLPPAVGLAAYRIVQEALTNTVRHSLASSVSVRLRRGRGHVLVQVTDNGRADADAVEGNGIRGMRERVAELGGTLRIGPGRDGWRVEARLPT